MKIFGFIVFSIVSLSLLIWILSIAFLNQSLVDAFTLNGTFGNWGAYDVTFTFILPLVLLLPFIVIAFSIITRF